MPDSDLVTEIARRHLPLGIADRWLRLQRPAARLRHATANDRVAVVLGGKPMLPDPVPWPSWEDHGPLTFIASADCAELAAVPLDIKLPADGTLLFFYFDGQYDNHQATIGYWDPVTAAGARALYLAPDEHAAPRQCPAGITPYPQVNLAAEPIVTFPGFEHPDLHAAFKAAGDDLRAFLGHPVNDDAFAAALGERMAGPRHQVGGYADPVQGPVEWEAAMAVLGNPDRRDPRLGPEQARWTLLAQIDTDNRAGMMWGDCGALYWLTRRDDLARGEYTNTAFTWQCS